MSNYERTNVKIRSYFLGFVLFFGLQSTSLFTAAAQAPGSPEGPIDIPTCTPTPSGGCEEWGLSVHRYTQEDSISWNIENAPECMKIKLTGMWNSCANLIYPGDCMLARLLGIQYADHDWWNLSYDWKYKSDEWRYFYFDYKCETYLPREGAAGQARQDCFGAFVSAASPISLLFGVERESDETAVFTRFPLDPRKAGGVFTWKASDKAPLLVYDPAHTGKILSARQLFGEWTFGGKQTAFKTSGATANDFDAPLGGAWRDGFQALESLDADGDGKVSGIELAPLGLWFDANRDGISQPGEVRTLTTEGITALYYLADRTDADTKSIYVERGYDRVNNGKVTSGIAVDWYAQAADSTFTLLMDRMLAERRSSERPSPAADAPLALNAPAGPFSGVWRWQETGAKDKPASGNLVLSDREGNGRLKGASVLELPFTSDYQRKTKAKSLMTVMTFNGQKNVNPQGERYVEFTVSSGGGSSTATKAVLSKDGSRLSGESKLSTVSNKGRKIEYSYQWSASRMK